MINNRFSIILIALCLFSENTWCEQSFYLLGKTGRANIDIDEEFLNFNASAYSSDTSGLNFAVGYKPIKNLGIELGHYSIGSISFFEDNRIEFDGSYLAAVGELYLSDQWYVMGKYGLMDWNADANPHNTSQDEFGEDTSNFSEIGIGWAFHKHWDLVGTCFFFDDNGLSITLPSVGVRFIF